MKKSTKITEKQIIQIHSSIIARIKKYNQKLTKAEFKPVIKVFIEENCPYLVGKIYEAVSDVPKRKGFNRFLVTEREMTFAFGGVMVRVCGYWLDKENVPAKREMLYVYGFSNPSVLKLSEIQKKNPVPQMLKDQAEAIKG
jgi:hypothetical protein